MKPVTYYIQNEQIDKLVEHFGADLNLLDREQKLQLRVTLTYFILGQDHMGQEYSINDAWCDSLQHLLCEDPQIHEAMEILQKITIDQAESLLEALQAQCRYGNARLKTSIESMTDELVKHGAAKELAKDAASILLIVDTTRERTHQEQETINQLHQVIIHNAPHRRLE